jgi:hypothetical protein
MYGGVSMLVVPNLQGIGRRAVAGRIIHEM